MIRYTLFRALHPDRHYPKSPFPLKISDVHYDLPLPTEVGETFLELLSDKGDFRRVDKYCETGSFDKIRGTRNTFGSDPGMPSYVEAELRVKCKDDNWTMLHVLQQAAANKTAAAEIARYAMEGQFKPSVAKWIMENSIFFQHGGGFEIAHGTFYFSADINDSDDIYVEQDSNSTEREKRIDQKKPFLMFREMLARAS